MENIENEYAKQTRMLIEEMCLLREKIILLEDELIRKSNLIKELTAQLNNKIANVIFPETDEVKVRVKYETNNIIKDDEC